MTAHRERKKHITGGKLLILLFLIALVIVVVFLIFLGCLYYNQFFDIENPDILVDTAIVQTIGNSYDDNQFLTRQEVFLIISDVFFGLKQEGFEQTDSPKDVIDQAHKLEILKGDKTGDNLERLATKQEVLVFIARSLRISNETDGENSPTFSTDSLGKWARPQIEGLVIQGYFSVSEIDRLNDLRENITIQELEGILNQIVEVKTRPMGFWKFTVFWIKNNKVLSILIALPSATLTPITIISFIMQLADRAKQKKKLVKGTVCLAGLPGVGKSTLKTKLRHSGELIYALEHKMVPTRTTHWEDVMIPSQSGDLPVTIIDTPGSRPEDVLQIINDHYDDYYDDPYEEMILLLVLAHTETYEGDEMDEDLIQEQLVEIRKRWTMIIRGCSNKIDKIVIFINKTDLLSKKDLPAQKHIYEKHMKLLYEAAKAAKVPIEAAEGSSTNGENLDALCRLLTPRSI